MTSQTAQSFVDVVISQPGFVEYASTLPSQPEIKKFVLQEIVQYVQDKIGPTVTFDQVALEKYAEGYLNLNDPSTQVIKKTLKDRQQLQIQDYAAQYTQNVALIYQIFESSLTPMMDQVDRFDKQIQVIYDNLCLKLKPMWTYLSESEKTQVAGDIARAELMCESKTQILEGIQTELDRCFRLLRVVKVKYSGDEVITNLKLKLTKIQLELTRQKESQTTDEQIQHMNKLFKETCQYLNWTIALFWLIVAAVVVVIACKVQKKKSSRLCKQQLAALGFKQQLQAGLSQ